MTIKEEPQIIEFSFQSEIEPSAVYTLKYQELSGNSTVEIKGMISQSSQGCIVPVDFFKEVYEYFVQKGVFKGGKKQVPGIASGSFVESLLPPSVKKKYTGENNEPASSTPAFASFDVSNSPAEFEQAEEHNEDKIVQDPEKKETSTGKKEPVINRQVIRTQPSDSEDPLAAEKEAAAIRGTGTSEKSGFKRA